MKLLSVKLQKQNYLKFIYETLVELPIANASSTDRFILQNLDGVSSEDVNVFMTNTNSQKGFYQGRRAENKEPVLLIGLNPDYGVDETVSGLRKYFYQIIVFLFSFKCFIS